MNKNLSRFAIALSMSVPLLAAARTGGSPAPAEPAPQLRYRSAFDDYKPYRDIPLANWRSVNDTVAGAPGGASGHAGHGLEGATPPPMPDAAASAPTPMKRPGHEMLLHDGHRAHGGRK